MSRTFVQPTIDLTQPHVFIDWETLATTADAKLLSLGAAVVWPTLEVEPIAYWNILRNEGQLNRRVSQATKNWWEKQSPTVKEKLATDLRPLEQVVQGLIKELDALGDTYFLWGNGADFDLAILWHALEQYGLQLPHWHYTKARCFRQFKSMYPTIKQPEFHGQKHYALDDALHEARWFVKILTEAGYV